MNVDRRDFLSGCLGAVTLSALSRELRSNPVLAATIATDLAMDPLRPQFHLLPTKNWMNDPNGPIYWKGNYHMFYQYNPSGAYWGNMHWGHAISIDMVRWRHLPVALSPTPGGPDADGCFTGTGLVQDGKVIAMYTGVHAAPEDQATNKDGVQSLREAQCLATSEDPELKTWTKLPEPVIASPPVGMQVNGFRDPSPWRQGDWWYAVLGSGIEGQGGTVLLYKSKDLRNWDYVHILAGRNQNGAHPLSPYDPWEVWECPEFFALRDRHVLICSTLGKAYWQSGRLDEETMTFHPEQSGILDYGSFYAPKTQLDKSGNRILWGWIKETRLLAEYEAAGWAGLMSLPRVLTLDTDGRLRMRVAAEVNGLRMHKQALNVTAEEESNQLQINALRVERCSGEILCTVRRTSEPFELVLHDSAENPSPYLTVSYDPRHPGQVSIDGRPVPVALSDGENVEIHLYIDSSVVEALVNNQVAWTKRFYYEGKTTQDLCIRWIGKTTNIVTLIVWQMSPISADRLTS
jgi:beta-fructofuranosidase